MMAETNLREVRHVVLIALRRLRREYPALLSALLPPGNKRR